MLSHERDRLGVNRVRLDWRLTELDRQSANRTTAILCEDLQRAGVLTVKRKSTLGDHEPPYWNWHRLGQPACATIRSTASSIATVECTA